jgi:UDP-2,3-diacylglucosamine pyrophosphatase LpxH
MRGHIEDRGQGQDVQAGGRPLYTGAVVCASDLHLGLWGDRNARYSRAQKLSALESIVELANREGGSLVLNGDILDDRADRKALKRECRRAREVLANCARGLVFVRGNHDAGFSRRKVRKRLGDCRIAGGWIHYDPCGVAFTHGHVLETRRSKHLIRRLGGLSKAQWKEINASLKADAALQAELAEQQERDLAVRPLESMERFRRAFELAECGFQRLRAGASEWLRWAAGGPGNGLHKWADRLDSRMIRRGAQLANALDAWACLVGHDHTPGLHRRTLFDPVSGRARHVLVGNCGAFIQHGQAITCVAARWPELRMMEFDAATGGLTVVQTVALPGESKALPQAVGVGDPQLIGRLVAGGVRQAAA